MTAIRSDVLRGDEAGASGAVRVALKGDSRCEWPSRRTLSNMARRRRGGGRVKSRNYGSLLLCTIVAQANMQDLETHRGRFFTASCDSFNFGQTDLRRWSWGTMAVDRYFQTARHLRITCAPASTTCSSPLPVTVQP